jgi:hypothetical protein
MKCFRTFTHASAHNHVRKVLAATNAGYTNASIAQAIRRLQPNAPHSQRLRPLMSALRSRVHYGGRYATCTLTFPAARPHN